MDANISDHAHAQKCYMSGELSQILNEFMLRSHEDQQIGLGRSARTVASVQHQSLVHYSRSLARTWTQI